LTVRNYIGCIAIAASSRFDRLNDHCLHKINQADRGFCDDKDQPFVTKIENDDVTPKKGE
jgi:hypothetical protein